MRLVRVELHRFRARRAVALTLLGVTLFVAWLSVNTIWETRSVSPAEVATAREHAELDSQFLQEEYERCKADPEAIVGEGASVADCASPEPDYQWYLPRQPLSLEEELGDTGTASIVALTGLALIVGATFAGADWATGSIGNQLLFRPRRLQVWGSKAAAVVIGLTVVAAFVLTAQWTAYLITAELRGIEHGAAFMGDLVAKNLRGLALIGGAGLGGFALTMLLRSTVGTLAVLFAYAVGSEALLAALPLERVSRWSLGNNLFAFLNDGQEFFDDAISCGPAVQDCSQSFTIGLGQSAWFLGVLLALGVAGSILSFRRRDVA